MVMDWLKLVAQKTSLYVNTYNKQFVWWLCVYKYCQYLHNGMSSIKKQKTDKEFAVVPTSS